MSVASDYMEIIDGMWQMQVYNMWLPYCYTTTAFLVDTMSKTEEYDLFMSRIRKIIKNKDFQTFSLFLCHTLRTIAENNHYEDILKRCNRICDSWKRIIAKGNPIVGTIGVPDEYIPEWFLPIYKTHMAIKEMDKETRIRKYIKEHGYDKADEDAIYKKLEEHYGFLNELYSYLLVGQIVDVYPQAVYTVTAKYLCEDKGMTPLQAYLEMIRLRSLSKDEFLQTEYAK